MAVLTLDDLREEYPDFGFALYAYTPGGPVTLEVHTPDGSIFEHHSATAEGVFSRAFPHLVEDAQDDNLDDLFS